VDAHNLETFFEPLTAIVVERRTSRTGKPVEETSLNLDAAVLNSWMQHVSQSTRVKMRSFEDAILTEISERRFISAAVIARAHMEVAAFAMLAEESILEFMNNGDDDKFSSLVHKMLYGTSFKLEGHIKDIQERLHFSQGTPLRPGRAIDAMDASIARARSEETQESQAIYAMLCEYCHPSIGGSKSFIEIVKETGEGWWTVYQREERWTDEEVVTLLRILLRNARLGCAFSLLLANGQFTDIDDGLVYDSPSGDVGGLIWTEFLGSPDEG
jgi:hypothetical protein